MAAEVRGITHTGFEGMVGVGGIPRGLFWLASMNASFASWFLATLLATSYHPSGSSKSGAPFPSRATLFCVVGSRPLWNLISTVNQLMYSSTKSLPWYQFAPSSHVRAESCSFFGVKWFTKSVSKLFQSGECGWPDPSAPRTLFAPRAARQG